MPNHLINETSPYLLQHAHQPVDWHPYSEQIFEKAKQEHKPILISIGYSTCHWCHVMAHECFDDQEVAQLMNQYFINVKVDREELPDVDKYYMNGLQVLTGHGGWPLNVFVLPNKKMFYGLTYAPRQKWIELLKKIYHLYINEYDKLLEYAENIHQGIKQFELPVSTNEQTASIPFENIKQKVNEWKNLFDKEFGGHQYTPKFVMPVNYKFFLHYTQFEKNEEVLNHIHNSILHIALGGLFDHTGGGFYRYSTDRHWKIPHFEKMLYDNAQMTELLSLYNLQFPSEEIQFILEKNIQFVLRDMCSDEHLFYSAWDADSEGQEGKFYTWTLDELKNILQNDFDEFAEIFNIANRFGYWENNQYVLTINLPLFLQNKTNYIPKIRQWTEQLFLHRKNRIHPSVDTKIITSWNGLMIKALCIASASLNKPEYLHLAEQSMHSLINKLYVNKQLYRIYHHQQHKIPAYLDDYAFLTDALITLAQHTTNPQYLALAQEITEQAIQQFYAPAKKLFYYTSPQHSISESIELYDDVIPSANAQMIKNLFYLSHLENNSHFKNIAEQVFQNTHSLFFTQPHHTASYGILILDKIFTNDMEICIAGKKAAEYLHELFSQIWFVPNIFTTSIQQNTGVFQNRFHSDKTFIYVCRHSACYEPIENPHHFRISEYL